jgi:hypothetical protein
MVRGSIPRRPTIVSGAHTIVGDDNVIINANLGITVNVW